MSGLNTDYPTLAVNRSHAAIVEGQQEARSGVTNPPICAQSSGILASAYTKWDLSSGLVTTRPIVQDMRLQR
jgi:hypothetical protein